MDVPGLGFVGVHIGAGQHAKARTPAYLAICSNACASAIEILRNGGNAVDAAAKATTVLEDAGETNAGFGSNLTEYGTVEMDAGIMDGSSLLFGAVGAIPDIKNPIMVAKLLLEEQKKGLLPLGRVPPLFMVGDGARDWAVRHGIPAVQQKGLISEKASKLFNHYKKKLDANKVAPQTKAKKREISPDANDSDESKRIHMEVDDRVTDTVGVVVMDIRGNVASTVSSGGIALKQPGRVGQASCFGCGCWAQNATRPMGFSVGVSTTGCGEHLVRTFLARECATELGRATVPLLALRDVMKEQFVESEFLATVTEKLGGAICLHYDRANRRGEFLWTHTTHSMGLAFQTTACAKPTAKMSRLPDVSHGKNKKPNRETTILVEGINISDDVRHKRDATARDNEEDDDEVIVIASNNSHEAEVQMTIESARA